MQKVELLGKIIKQLAEIIYNAVYDENTNFIWLNN